VLTQNDGREHLSSIEMQRKPPRHDSPRSHPDHAQYNTIHIVKHTASSFSSRQSCVFSVNGDATVDEQSTIGVELDSGVNMICVGQHSSRDRHTGPAAVLLQY
jgi:hypothetical protein